MYIIKIKGKAKIPDYIQIRDDAFILVGYFRADRPLPDLEKFGLKEQENYLQTLIKELPFGKLTKLEI
ncbi:MAG: fructose-6-phosphate aldolase [Cyclobacteriaceae bacterium]|nr:fructose-6-phosphate aldolase [Cyclobacteriaceae bacterium]